MMLHALWEKESAVSLFYKLYFIHLVLTELKLNRYSAKCSAEQLGQIIKWKVLGHLPGELTFCFTLPGAETRYLQFSLWGDGHDEDREASFTGGKGQRQLGRLLTRGFSLPSEQPGEKQTQPIQDHHIHPQARQFYSFPQATWILQWTA